MVAKLRDSARIFFQVWYTACQRKHSQNAMTKQRTYRVISLPPRKKLAECGELSPVVEDESLEGSRDSNKRFIRGYCISSEILYLINRYSDIIGIPTLLGSLDCCAISLRCWIISSSLIIDMAIRMLDKNFGEKSGFNPTFYTLEFPENNSIIPTLR